MPHPIDQLTQGGQVWLHNLRMLRQVIKTALLVGLVSGCAWMVFQLYRSVDGYFCYLWVVDLWAEIKLALLGLFTEEHTIMITYVERTPHTGGSHCKPPHSTLDQGCKRSTLSSRINSTNGPNVGHNSSGQWVWG